MKLHAIPPANRHSRVSPNRISSMRASVQTGFAGGGIGSVSHTQQPAVDTFIPHVIAADHKVAKARQAVQAAVDNLTEQLEALCQTARDMGEATEVKFWEAALARLRGARKE